MRAFANRAVVKCRNARIAGDEDRWRRRQSPSRACGRSGHLRPSASSTVTFDSAKQRCESIRYVRPRENTETCCAAAHSVSRRTAQGQWTDQSRSTRCATRPCPLSVVDQSPQRGRWNQRRSAFNRRFASSIDAASISSTVAEAVRGYLDPISLELLRNLIDGNRRIRLARGRDDNVLAVSINSTSVPGCKPMGVPHGFGNDQLPLAGHCRTNVHRRPPR